MPSLDLVIRETIRIALGGTFLRRSVAKDMEIQGVKIKKGDFLAYTATDVHMNEDIYTDPKKFDPSRFEIGREEDKKVNFAYLGWGAGEFEFLKYCEQIVTYNQDVTLVVERKLRNSKSRS